MPVRNRLTTFKLAGTGWSPGRKKLSFDNNLWKSRNQRHKTGRMRKIIRRTITIYIKISHVLNKWNKLCSTFLDLSVEGRIRLNVDLKEKVCSREHGNEISDSVNDEGFLKQLS
jgi:hypothetical protein